MDVINLDHNATTPIRPEVVEAMVRCWKDGYANPASQHQLGARARRLVEESREAIASILGADVSGHRPDRLIFTSGGTEANNLAILGISRARARCAGRDSSCWRHQLIISGIEHSSVLEPAERLLEEGWRLDTVGATTDGVVRLEQLEAWLGPNTRLVSVIWGNHETGVLQPIEKVVQLCAGRNVLVHTDAVQAVGKVRVDFRKSGVAAMSIGAHKFQGPVGIGALLCAQDTPLEPIFFGGHQQEGMRPGTEPVALVVGMRTALELWSREVDQHFGRLIELRDRFERALREQLPEILIHGQASARLPHTSNIAFLGLDAQSLLMALDLAGIACSIGSACSSGSAEPSPTLRAMGLPAAVVASSVRFSLGATTTDSEIDEAVRRIVAVVHRLRNKACRA